MGCPMECAAATSALSVDSRGGVQAPGNALGINSRVVGEKTLVTSSASGVQPGGGRRFAAAQADTTSVSSHNNRVERRVHEAKASPPVTIATLLSAFEIRRAASSNR